MIEVMPKLWVGSDQDYHGLRPAEAWAVVHASKEPYHREALGYKTLGAPKAHLEYLVALRGNRLCLNMVDIDDPKWISPFMINSAISFIQERLKSNWSVLVHCNQGGSRGPGVAMAYMAHVLPPEFDEAEREFTKLYPAYAPRAGIRGYLMNNWDLLSKGC